MSVPVDFSIIYRDFLKTQFNLSDDNSIKNKGFPSLDKVNLIRQQAAKECDSHTFCMASLCIAEISRYIGQINYANKMLREINLFNKSFGLDEDSYSFYYEVSARMHKNAGDFMMANDIFGKALKHTNSNNHARILLLKEEQADCLLHKMKLCTNSDEIDSYIKTYTDFVLSIDEIENTVKYSRPLHYLTVKRKLFCGKIEKQKAVESLQEFIKEYSERLRTLDVINAYTILAFAYNLNKETEMSVPCLDIARALSEDMLLLENIKILNDLERELSVPLTPETFYPVLESASLMFS